MRSSLKLLMAGLLAGGLVGASVGFAQTPPAAPEQVSPTPAPTPKISPEPVNEAPPPKPFRLGDRLRNLFAPRPAENRVQQTKAVQAAPAVPAPTPLPKGITELSAKELEQVGHEQDYSWITGKLFRVEGGLWVLRYAGPYEVDRYNGGVQLTPHADLAKHQPGDLVCVLGRVTSTTRDSRLGAGTVYQLTSISLIDHGKR